MYQALLWNQPLEIETAEGLFSPRGADAGTLCMVSAVELESGQKLLDLGWARGWWALRRRKCWAKKTSG